MALATVINDKTCWIFNKENQKSCVYTTRYTCTYAHEHNVIFASPHIHSYTHAHNTHIEMHKVLQRDHDHDMLSDFKTELSVHLVIDKS